MCLKVITELKLTKNRMTMTVDKFCSQSRIVSGPTDLSAVNDPFQRLQVALTLFNHAVSTARAI